MQQGSIGPSGALTLEVLDGELWPRWPSTPSVEQILALGTPQRGLPGDVNTWRRSNLRHLWRGARRVLTARALRLPTLYGALYGRVIRGDGTIVDIGLMSLRVVTTVGAGYIVDAAQNLVEIENMKYHGFGTGTNAEAVGDTALQTELTTQYAVDNTRPTGTQTENGATVYRTVATLSPDSGGTIAVTEHGIFSQAATGGGVLLDRSVFAAYNLVAANGDSLQTTYDLTITPGS